MRVVSLNLNELDTLLSASRTTGLDYHGLWSRCYGERSFEQFGNDGEWVMGLVEYWDGELDIMVENDDDY